MTMLIFYTIQLVVALGLLNVWLLRYNKATAYRGGAAKNLKDEFSTYGIEYLYYPVGILKVGSAVILLAGLFVPFLTAPASGVILILMIGAVLMHIKVRDPIKKALPASAMLVMSSMIFFNSL